MRAETLFHEYREDVLENIHEGMVCVADEKGIAASVGDTDWICYYRSCSKLIQSLPVIERKLDRKYGLTEEETAIFSGSHKADADHIRVLESIMEKTGLKEEQMIMLPTYPMRPADKEQFMKAGMPPRKIYHNCSGKHLGLMLLARELGEPVEKYWIRESRTQQEILRVISQMTDVPAREIKIGVDGCGVPVYAVPFHAIATSYLRLVRPELIKDEVLKEAVTRNMAMLHKYPNMIAGYGDICTVMTADEDLVAKSGAMGVFTMGIRSMGLGIVFKILDGSQAPFEDAALHILTELGYDKEKIAGIAEGCHFSNVIVNDNKEKAGYRKAVFSLKNKT